MWSSYETCRGNATQDKRSGRRTAWATFDDFDKVNRTGHLLGGAPPKTGWADDGAHGRILIMARRLRQGWQPEWRGETGQELYCALIRRRSGRAGIFWLGNAVLRLVGG